MSAKPDCPDCRGSGYVNDQGPGVGGSEYAPCDCASSGPKPHAIVCAALRLKTEEGSKIICGVRHFDPLMRDQIDRDYFTGWKCAEQGFVNTHGEFLTREEALAVALQLGQRKRRCGGDERQLFSENLY